MAGTRRIAVFSIDAKLPGEVKGATRYIQIAEMLVAAGFEVDFITSRFQHWDKAFRAADSRPDGSLPYNVRFIEEPGYPKNMCPQRIWSHRVAARNVRDYFDAHHDYDLIYCQIPPNDVTLEAGRAAKRYGIPFVIDVNDLWPEAFRVAFDVPVVSDIVFAPFYRQARRAYALADAIVGTSDEYSGRAFKDRAEDIPRLTVYVGNDLAVFDRGAAVHAAEVAKPADEIWVAYAGTLSACYDLDTLIRAVARAQRRDSRIKLKLLGDGVARADLERVAAETGCDVDFLGYVPYEVMAAWLSKSDILVNSLVANAAQSVVTKIGDYLAAGKPMVNTSRSPEFWAKVERDGFGVNVAPEDPVALESVLVDLAASPERRCSLGRVARDTAEREFDRAHSYAAIVQLIEKMSAPA